MYVQLLFLWIVQQQSYITKKDEDLFIQTEVQNALDTGGGTCCVGIRMCLFLFDDPSSAYHHIIWWQVAVSYTYAYGGAPVYVDALFL